MASLSRPGRGRGAGAAGGALACALGALDGIRKALAVEPRTALVRALGALIGTWSARIGRGCEAGAVTRGGLLGGLGEREGGRNGGCQLSRRRGWRAGWERSRGSGRRVLRNQRKEALAS